MNRRGFLQLLAGAGAATATSYFFAPIGGWKSDAIVHTSGGIWDDPCNVAMAAQQMGLEPIDTIYGIPCYLSVSSDMQWLGIRRDSFIGKPHRRWKTVRKRQATLDS